jgi:ELWxxDGT repeat protein
MTGGTYNFAGDFTAVGNTIYFLGGFDDGTAGSVSGQLWSINDGTASPVTPSKSWAFPPTNLTALDDSTLLFIADDGSGHGTELWKSDGTDAGTTMVKDVNPGPASGFFPLEDSSPADWDSPIAVIGGVAYFSASDGSLGEELWKSDGTTSGTALVKDINPGSASSSPQSLTDSDGKLYFVAHDGSGANQLWTTDGTANGTSLVRSFSPAKTGSSNPSDLTVVNGTLYFSADDGIHGSQLWKSDGTASGTTMVTDLLLNNGFYPAPSATSVVSLNGSLFFEASIPEGPNSAIERSDGTPAGTTTIFTPESASASITGLIQSQGSLYFLTTDSSDSGSAVDLWKSDGTSSGTTLVTTLPNTYQGGYLTDVNGKIFFCVSTTSPGADGAQNQLWSSDGTTPGTTEVLSLGGMVQAGAAVGNDYVFAESDSTGPGESIWVSDGTAGGTVLLHDFATNSGYPSGYGGTISSLTPAGGRLYFVATTGNGTQLWATDGTAAGTIPLTTANPGSGGVNPGSLVTMGGKLYFLANAPGKETDALWQSDGTVSGTTVVADLPGGSGFYPGGGYSHNPGGGYPGYPGGGPPTSIPGGGLFSNDQLVASNNRLFVAHGNGSSPLGLELWESDGTKAGTTDVGNLPQTGYNFAAVGSTLFFTASDGRGTELWSASQMQPPPPPPPPITPPKTPPTTPTSPPVGSPTSSPTSTPATPTSPSPAPTTSPAPAPKPTQAPTPVPTIVGEHAVFLRKTNKKGKPIGKAVLAGFALQFSRPMSASAANAADYQLAEVRGKGAGKNKAAHLTPVGITVSYDAASETVTLDVAGKHSFSKGGVLAVNTAITSALGKSLGGASTFVISPRGKNISAI